MGGGIDSSADERAMDNLVSFIIKNLAGHEMANMFGDANKAASSFTRVGGKSRVASGAVDGFVEVEPEQGTDVGCLTGEGLRGGDPIESLTCCVVENEAGELSSKQPAEGRCPRAMKNSACW